MDVGPAEGQPEAEAPAEAPEAVSEAAPEPGAPAPAPAPAVGAGAGQVRPGEARTESMGPGMRIVHDPVAQVRQQRHKVEVDDALKYLEKVRPWLRGVERVSLSEEGPAKRPNRCRQRTSRARVPERAGDVRPPQGVQPTFNARQLRLSTAAHPRLSRGDHLRRPPRDSCDSGGDTRRGVTRAHRTKRRARRPDGSRPAVPLPGDTGLNTSLRRFVAAPSRRPLERRARGAT